MTNIEVKVLQESGGSPAGMMMFLAKLTQRGHSIKTMSDLQELFHKTIMHHPGVDRVVSLPHSTIKRFTPITVAIVGASRRFLAQARTHQVGITYVSASLQYSDYTDEATFVVPYALMEKDANKAPEDLSYVDTYLAQCREAMEQYKYIAENVDNDTAGYIAPQGLSNILIIQANHESWSHFIKLRSCNRNTNETQYVTLRIWEELLKTIDGKEMFKWAGPECLYGPCREGKMACKALNTPAAHATNVEFDKLPTHLLREGWPLLYGDTQNRR